MTRNGEVHRWQFEVREVVGATSLEVLRVRRPKQSWMPAADAPEHVRQYLTLPASSSEGSFMREIDSLDALASLERVVTVRPQVFQVEIPKPRRGEGHLPARRYSRSALWSVRDLCGLFAAETLAEANHHLDRHAGPASVSVYGTLAGCPAAVHSPSSHLDLGWDRETGRHLGSLPLVNGVLPVEFTPESFSIQASVYGSEVVVGSERFYFGRCTRQEVERWLSQMEEEVQFYYRRDNVSLYRILCGEGEFFAELDCGECDWSPEPPETVRTLFERWLEGLEEEPAEGESVTFGTCSVERLDRSMECF